MDDGPRYAAGDWVRIQVTGGPGVTKTVTARVEGMVSQQNPARPYYVVLGRPEHPARTAWVRLIRSETSLWPHVPTEEEEFAWILARLS